MEGSLALRALQLRAYAAAIDALRVGGPNTPNAQQLIETLKRTFKISEPRHSAEVRRACSDRSLRQIEEQTVGRDTSAAWLRRVRRTVPPSTEPIGVTSSQRKKLADDILLNIERNRNDPKSIHVVLRDEDAQLGEGKTEAGETPTIKTNFEPAGEDTRIRLPGGTVIRIGEERQDPSKPGRKRKGDIVIKEVESKRPVRERRVPKRFIKSPTKTTQVKRAVTVLRKRLNIDRVGIGSTPKKAARNDSKPEPKVEPKFEPRPMKSEPVPTAAIIISNGRRCSAEINDNDTIPRVIVKAGVIQTGQATGVIQSPQTQSCTIVTLPVTQPLRRSNPSTPFMMNDILGGGGSRVSTILPNTSRPSGMIKCLPELAPSKPLDGSTSKNQQIRSQLPISRAQPSSLCSTPSKQPTTLDLPIYSSRGQVTPPDRRLHAEHMRQHSPISRQAPAMRIVPMAHTTSHSLPQSFTLHPSGTILGPTPSDARRGPVLHSSLDQSSQLIRQPMHTYGIRMTPQMMNQTLQPLSTWSLNPNMKQVLPNGSHYSIDRKLNSNNR